MSCAGVWRTPGAGLAGARTESGWDHGGGTGERERGRMCARCCWRTCYGGGRGCRNSGRQRAADAFGDELGSAKAATESEKSVGLSAGRAEMSSGRKRWKAGIKNPFVKKLTLTLLFHCSFRPDAFSGCEICHFFYFNVTAGKKQDWSRWWGRFRASSETTAIAPMELTSCTRLFEHL